jgi:hypothetical protein
MVVCIFLMQAGFIPPFQKKQLKIRIFVLLIHCKVLLTKDNLAKRNWYGVTCWFCDKEESIQHIFIECPPGRLVHM